MQGTRRAIVGLAVGCIVVLSGMNGVAQGAPSGEYLNEEEMAVYWYDAEKGTLTYQGPFGGQSMNGPESDPECIYSTVWDDPGSLYLSIGACASHKVAFAGRPTITFRDSVRETGSSIYQWRLDWTWQLSGGGTEPGSLEAEVFCTGDIVRLCETDIVPFHPEPVPETATGLCATHTLLKDGAVRRFSPEQCA